ncbi:MAG TPA: Ig-like domain-containing protein [Planctomycetota bacterium]|nr:Ig-like domain-containing protein [Planctomycetota bacterium]
MMHSRWLTRCLVLLAMNFGVGQVQAQVPPKQLIHTGAASPGTVTVTQAAGVYTLRFVGDETISYSVDTNDTNVKKGVIRVYESTSDCWPVRDAGVCFRNSGNLCYFPTNLAPYTTLTSVNSTASSLVLDYTLNFEGVHKMQTTYELKGKNLRIHVKDLDGSLAFLRNWAGLYVGPTLGTEEPKYLSMQGALSTPIVLFRKGAKHYFLGNMLDMVNSNAATVNMYKDPLQAGMTSVRYGLETYNLYKKINNGEVCGTLDDTLNITISSKIKDVLVTPNWPGSPYRDLLTGRVMVNFPNSVWTDYPALWNLFDSWGLDNVAGYFFHWSNSAPDYIGDTFGPDWYPAKNSNGFKTAVQSGVAKGFLLGGNMSFSAMPSTAAASVYNPAHIAKKLNGAWKTSVQSNMPMMAATAAGIHADRESALVKTNYDATLGYVDIQTYAGPQGGADGDHLDQDGVMGWAQTIRAGVHDQQEWLGRMADTFMGPMSGEGSIGTEASSCEWLWAGYCDSVQRAINTGAGIAGGYNFPAGDPRAPTNWPVIPEYEVRVMSRIQANHGNGFADRFFGKSDGPGIVDMNTGKPILPLTEKALDKYRAYVVTYSKMAHFETNGPYNLTGNYISFADTLKTYYLTNALQALYYDGAATQIQYMHQGRLKSFETILFQTETCDSFRHPQLKEVFSNGLELYVNHSTTPWSVIADGVSYVIPEDGFVAVRPGTQFVAFSAIPASTGGQRIDYCYAPNEYEFFDGRGVINGYGNLDTGGKKRTMFKNFAHNVTGKEDSSQAIVLTNGPAPTVVRVDVLPAQTSVQRGARRGMKAIATYSNGAVRNVTSLVNWSAANANIASINEGAALTANALGQTTIQVSSYQGAPVTPATVTVVP